ncbi:hypothetical protein R6Q59_004918 [Mikania micrantha]
MLIGVRRLNHQALPLQCATVIDAAAEPVAVRWLVVDVGRAVVWSGGVAVSCRSSTEPGAVASSHSLFSSHSNSFSSLNDLDLGSDSGTHSDVFFFHIIFHKAFNIYLKSVSSIRLYS